MAGSPQEAWRRLTAGTLAGALAGGTENYEAAVASMRELIDEFPAEHLLEEPGITQDDLASVAGRYLEGAQAELEEVLNPSRKHRVSPMSSSTGPADG